MNTLWGLDWPLERLREVAAGLGADMPFCLSGGYAHGTGFGERITPLEEDRIRQLRDSGFAGPLVVGAYQAELRTPEVYATFDELGGDPDHDNDLQRAAISLHPRSGAAVRAALQAGATHAFVSGSGPSVVAFAPDAARLQAIANAWRESAAVDRIIAADAPATPKVHVHTA